MGNLSSFVREKTKIGGGGQKFKKKKNNSKFNLFSYLIISVDFFFIYVFISSTGNKIKGKVIFVFGDKRGQNKSSHVNHFPYYQCHTSSISLILVFTLGLLSLVSMLILKPNICFSLRKILKIENA